ncbi:hypothetical protein [Bifidobacterium leontopitheci]|uniref:Uncharacterized protein n=1 Tax=Bifidobacterium leontopitheci TaxID=2650774 RepID=A0A6I1GN99_9BIFI|nr:hypothetical protein [Bifidobacterium leontopitheci]KAB7789528.1 hypothetical protein F7D09_1976 [Bifidobacterium leontopitheci]
MIADQCVGELRAFDGDGGGSDGGVGNGGHGSENGDADAGTSTETTVKPTAGVRFLTVLQPDSAGVAAVYDAVAAL